MLKMVFKKAILGVFESIFTRIKNKKADFAEAVVEAEKKKESLENTLLNKELIKDEQLGQVIAEANSSAASHDEETAARLWQVSAELTGLAAFSRERPDSREANRHHTGEPS